MSPQLALSNKPTLLIVDDAPDNLALMSGLLKDSYKVKTATNGANALRIAHTDPAPHLILLDIMMPEMDGYEICAQLKADEKTRDIPIIFLTAKIQVEDEQKGFAVGAVDYITKPVSEPILKARIHTHLALRDARIKVEMQGKLLLQQREHELQEFKDALDQHAIVSIADRAGNILYVNEKFCEVSGYNDQELIGQNHRILNDGMDPAIYADLWQTIASGRVWHGELRNKRKDGRPYWVESSIIPLSLDEFGVPERYISIRTEVTALKSIQEALLQSEEVLLQQKNMLEVLQQAVLRYINDAEPQDIAAYLLQAMLKVTNSELGFLGEIRHDEHGAPYLFCHAVHGDIWINASPYQVDSQGYGLEFHNPDCLIGSVFTSGKPVFSNNTVNDTQPGRLLPPGHRAIKTFLGVPVYYEGRLLAMYGIANRKNGYDQALLERLSPFATTVAVVMDAMRRAQEKSALQQQLLMAKEEAESASNAKSEFLSCMSHELRTPLNAILGFAQLLDSDPDEPLSAAQKESTEQILQAGWHLLRLINEVLDLARVESGKISLDMQDINLKVMLNECMNLLAPLAAEKRIQMSISAEITSMHQVVADEIRFKQVLLNLLSNAIKYNREQGEVNVSLISAGANRLRIAVSDSGIGMNEEQLAHLFEAFNRVGAERSGIPGTGIGLVVAKRFVEIMDGEIGVYSRPGKGSTFWVELPEVLLVTPVA